MRPPEDASSDDESYYVPAGIAPQRVVRGPSVKDMQLYGSEKWDLLRAERERMLALRHQSAEHARLMLAMRRRQSQTPVEALRVHIQRTSRMKIARELDPETVRRRATSVDSAGMNQTLDHHANASGASGNAETEGTNLDVARDDAYSRMRRLPEGRYGTMGVINPDPAKSMAKRVAKQLAKVRAPHASWEGASKKKIAAPQRRRFS
jgi:hypothetical protein